MKSKNLLALAAAATLALAAGSAMADASYGYNAAVVTATAKVNLSVVVPKLILLRVGGTTPAAGDTRQWTVTPDIPGITGPLVSGGAPTAGAWTGVAPTTGSLTANEAALAVSAWTNNPTGGRISYTATDFNTGGPALNAVSVAAGTGLAHPTPLALATASTGNITFAAGAVSTGAWTYSLSNTGAGGWQAGTYSSVVTYTATSI